ncbi:MAG: deoxyribonuclease V [Acidobacteriota bacterium]
MKIPPVHRWDLSPSEAMALQRELADRVIDHDEIGSVHYVAGVDVGFEGERNRVARAAVVVLSYPALLPVDYAVARMPVTFPYIPGLLSFREIPVLLRAFEKIRIEPDLTIADGHGRAHPRRIGFASHLGLALDRPTIGCAKSRLVGTAAEPQNDKGAWTPLEDRGQVIGAVLRTRAGTRPVFVSIGHKVSLERAIEWVLNCCKGYRLPETTRYAHRAAAGEKIPLGGGHGTH